jgi:hypothetical protein
MAWVSFRRCSSDAKSSAGGPGVSAGAGRVVGVTGGDAGMALCGPVAADSGPPADGVNAGARWTPCSGGAVGAVGVAGDAGNADDAGAAFGAGDVDDAGVVGGTGVGVDWGDSLGTSVVVVTPAGVAEGVLGAEIPVPARCACHALQPDKLMRRKPTANRHRVMVLIVRHQQRDVRDVRRGVACGADVV